MHFLEAAGGKMLPPLSVIAAHILPIPILMVNIHFRGITADLQKQIKIVTVDFEFRFSCGIVVCGMEHISSLIVPGICPKLVAAEKHKLFADYGVIYLCRQKEANIQLYPVQLA
jgi:hypothetical protein